MATDSTRIGRALVVDDDPAMRSLIARELSRRLDTVAVATFTDALALVQEHELPFEAVVTDLRLGDGPTGMDLLVAAKRLRPSCVRILVSGEMTEDVAATMAVEGLADAAFGKPWPYGAIAEAILAALEDRAVRSCSA